MVIRAPSPMAVNGERAPALLDTRIGQYCRGGAHKHGGAQSLPRRSNRPALLLLLHQAARASEGTAGCWQQARLGRQRLDQDQAG